MMGRVRELLAQAVQCLCLDDSGGTSSQPQASQPHSSGDSHGTHTNPGLGSSLTSSCFTTPLSSRPSVLAERNYLFNYGDRGKRSVSKVIWLFLKYCIYNIYCASVPFLHRES